MYLHSDEMMVCPSQIQTCTLLRANLGLILYGITSSILPSSHTRLKDLYFSQA